MLADETVRVSHARPAPDSRLIAAVLLIFVFGSFALSDMDTPIVDGYVGRQVPTAMVTRNLGGGSGFLHPQLDTGPFPNLFLVEPPVFASLTVFVRKVSGWPIGKCGRYVSALAIVVGAWGLYGLIRRRAGTASAGLATIAFAILPVTLRYGHACQPDALMLGLLLAGFRQWDDSESGGGRGRLALAWLLTAAGLAVKVIAAPLLLVVILAIQRRRRVVLIASTLAPALLWYAYASYAMSRAGGSRASADNAALWSSAIGPMAWFPPGVAHSAARSLLWRAFTPVGVPLALLGLCVKLHPEDRLWRVWFVSATIALALVPGKLHHEYYGLLLAPAVAVGIYRAVSNPYRGWFSYLLKIVAFAFLIGWNTNARQIVVPEEWRASPLAAEAIDRLTGPSDLIAAPEALLFLADRKGCRLEYEPKARVRAAGEWGAVIDRSDPLALVELYRSKGAKFVADLWPVGDEPDRRALHDAIRRRYNVIMDRDGVIVAELVDRRN